MTDTYDMGHRTAVQGDLRPWTDGGVGTAVGRVHGDGVAARDQQLQVRRGLEGRQHRLNRSRSSSAARGGSRSAARRRRPPSPARPRRLPAVVEPVLVVGQQLVDPRVRPPADRAVRGQQRQVRQPAHLAARPGSRQRRVGRHRLEADRRVMSAARGRRRTAARPGSAKTKWPGCARASWTASRVRVADRDRSRRPRAIRRGSPTGTGPGRAVGAGRHPAVGDLGCAPASRSSRSDGSAVEAPGS